MKLFHLSDLHIGKMLHMYDMSDIQRDVFGQIINAAKKEKPDAVLIAGDIYDKAAPSGDMFDLFNDFLVEFSQIDPQIPVLIISGNHDSNLRLNYASSFIEKDKIYIAATLPTEQSEHLKKIEIEDEDGKVNFYLLPFTKPADAKNLLGEECNIRTYDDAVAAMLEREEIDFSQRNVLVAHQFFVSGGDAPERRESELKFISVGGIDSVDICHVDQFDYVALGHIHSSQKIGKDYIRYSGTPIKYSVSEAEDEKSITVVELGKKGSVPKISYIPLKMKHDVKKLRGTMNEILDMATDELKDAYVSITLTDEEVLFRPKDRLSEVYNHIIEVQIDNTRMNALLRHDSAESEDTDPVVLFHEFFQEMNGQPMSDKEQELLLDVINSITQTER